MNGRGLTLNIMHGRAFLPVRPGVFMPLDEHPYVVIPDPDDDREVPLYAGPAGSAGGVLADGEYAAVAYPEVA